MTVIVFPDRATADAVCKEIAATPAIEEGVGPVFLWFDPDAATNTVQYAQDATGRCAVAHPWSAADRAWLEAYLAAWPSVTVGDALPVDWVWPQAKV